MKKCVFPDWIDFPDDDYVAVLGYDTPNVRRLNSLIACYNEIAKDQIATLGNRVKILEKIIVFLGNWVENSLSVIDKKKHLIWIQTIAESKREYLSQLNVLYTRQLDRLEIQEKLLICDIKNNFFDSNSRKEHLPNDIADNSTDLEVKQNSYEIITLNNNRFFSLKMKEYWGDFWLEAIDPCHRRLTPFYMQWIKIKEHHPETPHFFLWLENQNLPKYIPRVKYLNPEELENARLYVIQGLLCKKKGGSFEPVHLMDTRVRNLFVIDLHKDIYIAEEEAMGISHSSFTHGRPVLGAGLMLIDQGILHALNLESGHYLPSIEIGRQILLILNEKAINLPETFSVTYFFDRNKYTASVQKDDIFDSNRFKNVLDLALVSNNRKACAL